MASIRSRLAYRYLKFLLARARQLNPTLEQRRSAADKGSPLLSTPKLITVEEIVMHGIEGEWLRPKSVTGPGIILYFHGGAYVFGSIKSHRRLAAHLASAARLPVFIFNYRLAPEFPFPAALEDAVAIYCAQLTDHPNVPIALAGDSAGAGLALAVALTLRDRRIAGPRALALMSPWTNLVLDNPTHITNAAIDPFFPDPSILTSSAASYAAGRDLHHPLISPQFADLSRLPATLIHVGDRETLLDDARQFYQIMQSQSGDVNLKIFPDMWHVWQIFVGLFPEADLSVAELGEFIQRHLNGAIHNEN